ncbi:MAG TPA: prenyltransferase, partial [Sandaracinaceae bacterium LLY-WYZ-13_1]|nr:prenyltransferase [Sandaracinaceae bacterium LLY-WYZ-13_1]
AIGLAAGRPSLTAFGLGLAFTVLDLLFVVFLNDWGDREVDAIKRRMFPKSSDKTIPDGLLPAHHLLFAGALCGAAALGVAFTGQILLDRPWLGALGLAALGVFVAYTLPPVRLNYRGGGELLEMLGVGVLLPWLQAYLQGGDPTPPGLWLLPGFALLSTASAVASGLSDERSDARGGKRTFVTRFGNLAGRRATEALVFAGACTWALTGTLGDTLPWWVTVPPAFVAFWYGGQTMAVSGAAQTDAFAAQRRYKRCLHHAIWRGGLCAAMLLATWHLWLQTR